MTSAELTQIESSLARVGGDVDRARSLVGNAMKELFATFERLRDHLAQERIHYESAIAAISGGAAGSGLVSVIRDVLGRFVKDIVKLSQSSVRILVEVDALRGHADSVASRGQRIEKIAQTTRVISLNARIEAQRVGADGAVFRVVADEIKSLANETSDLSKAIRTAIDQQAASLGVASQAANELAASDLNFAVESHQRLDETIARLAQVSKTSTEALERIQADIDQAIRALQFDDMLDQLLQAVRRKLSAIQTACNQLANGDAASLGELRAQIERDAVTQHDINEGSVELF